MKLLKLAATLIFTCVMITGCDTSSDSPENLLSDNIVYNKSRNKLYTFINQSLDGTTLLLPDNSSEVGEINELDEKIIAFQSKEDVNQGIKKVGFVLISKNGNSYKLEDSYLEEGEEIQYANFYDLNNDGDDEVVLLIKNNETTTMHVYSIKNDSIELVSTVKPTWLSNYRDYKNTKIKIGYMDSDSKGDSTLDILMVNYDNSTQKMCATVLNYDNSSNYNYKISNCLEFTDVRNIDVLYITLGKVYNNQKGLIINIPVLKDKDSGYNTQIITLKNNEISEVFGKDKIIFNKYYVPPTDMDFDGVLEFPELNDNKIESVSITGSSSALITWKKWNGKNTKESDTIFISQIYYNYKNNFKFLIPNNLANKLYVQKSMVNDSMYYTFYYYEKSDTKPIEIFQVSIYAKNIVEDAKSTPKLETILVENDNNYYQLIVKDKETFEKYNLTVENMKENFSLIYK